MSGEDRSQGSGFEGGAMMRVVIEDLEPAIVEKLEALARKHGRSLQAEVKSILETVVQGQAIDAPDANAVTKTPEELGWSPGFFERTAGRWEGEPLIRYPQGELQERNWDDLSIGY